MPLPTGSWLIAVEHVDQPLTNTLLILTVSAHFETKVLSKVWMALGSCSSKNLRSPI